MTLAGFAGPREKAGRPARQHVAGKRATHSDEDEEDKEEDDDRPAGFESCSDRSARTDDRGHRGGRDGRGTSGRGGAQPSTSQTDIQTLQEELEALRSEVAQLPDADTRLVELEPVIDTLDDEIAYLRVKLRRDDPVSQGEVDELRRRINALQQELSDRPSRFPEDVRIPVGTEMDVRLQSSLVSDTAQVEDLFYATVVNDLVLADREPYRPERRRVGWSVPSIARAGPTGALA